MTFANRIVNYGVKPADQFTANPKNARIHPQFQRDVMKDALDTIGFIAPVIENARTGYLIDGHERIMQALADNALVPFVSVDMSEDEEAYALATFDPITSLAAYDRAQLDTLLRDVQSDSEHIQRLLAELAAENGLYANGDNAPGDPGAAIDRAEALREQYGVERGQLWIAGRHRILCGDAYSDEDVSRLLDGEKPDMLHIDPPYGIRIVAPENLDRDTASKVGSTSTLKHLVPGESRHKGATAAHTTDAAKRSVGDGSRDVVPTSRRKTANTMFIDGQPMGATHRRSHTALIVQPNAYPVIEGDDRPFQPTHFLEHAPIIIMWGANYYAHDLPISSCWITWDKRENITRNDFADCELAWCNLDKPARVFHHLWNGLHKGSQHGQARTHPTEKPVALFVEIGKMFCDGGLWLDLFAGTGAQIVAAEQTGARCYASEIEPPYIATILDRLHRMGVDVRRG